MHYFAYRDRVLHAEAVNLAELADIRFDRGHKL